MRPYELPKVTEIDNDAYYVEDKNGVPTRAIKGSDLKASIMTGDSESSKRVEIQVSTQEQVFAGDPLKVTSSSPTEIFVARASAGEHACYVSKADYNGGDSNAIGVKVGGVIGLDTSGSTIGTAVYTAKDKGYTFVKTADYYQEVGTIARVGGNDGAICVGVLELHDSPIKSAIAGENLAINDICVMRSDGKMWKTNSLDGNAVGMIRISTAITTAESSGSFIKDGVTTISTVTVGAAQYLSSTGTVTETPPSSSGEIVRVLGYGHTTGLILDIDKSWGVIA